MDIGTLSFAVTTVALLQTCTGLNTIDLTGQWTVTNGQRGISIPGGVPGSMYTALIDNGDIDDPYYRRNDGEYAWVGLEDWTYNRTFSVDAELLELPAVMLVCEGLDTVSTVKVNNVTVGKSENMFIRYSYDIKSALVVGENSIVIEFQAAPSYVQEVVDSLPYTVLPECQSDAYHGTCGANKIRKMQCSFSWDWGPSFPTQGIWRDIYIQGYTTAAVRDVTSETTKNDDGTWQLKVDVFTEVSGDADSEGHMEVTLADTSVSVTKAVSLSTNNNMVTFDIAIPESDAISAWWPNGYGSQSLYELTVNYTDGLGPASTKTIRIGFRTVELVQDFVSNDESQGRTFYFRVNGQPIYLKGSNWIPADSFLERITRERLLNYMTSAADVHMNAMRVWGGGIYEFDMFYEIADELGIMIWQDFMFACSMYPTSDEFLDSVKQEVTYQVRRMKHHPSILVFAGNNENEAALRDNWYGTGDNFDLYEDDYIKLYIDTVRTTVLEEDTSRPFLSSSPSNGVRTEEEGWVSQNPSNTLYGDIHEYKYRVPFYDPSSFNVGRLGSEFGFQSYPSMESLEPVYDEEDYDYDSSLNEYRNHHPWGSNTSTFSL